MESTQKLWRLFMDLAAEYAGGRWYYCRFSDTRWTVFEVAGKPYRIEVLAPFVSVQERPRQITVAARTWKFTAVRANTFSAYEVSGDDVLFRCDVVVLRMAYSALRSA